MKLRLISVIVLCVMLFSACSGDNTDNNDTGDDEDLDFEMISAEKAKEIMDTESGYIILDVRTQEEYDGGHIEGAILIPDYEIEARAENELKDKDQLILVYCRSGRRSKLAAQALVELGYGNVKEFGGIIDWTYGTVKD